MKPLGMVVEKHLATYAGYPLGVCIKWGPGIFAVARQSRELLVDKDWPLNQIIASFVVDNRNIPQAMDALNRQYDLKMYPLYHRSLSSERVFLDPPVKTRKFVNKTVREIITALMSTRRDGRPHNALVTPFTPSVPPGTLW